MFGATLVFHVASAIFIAALLYKLIRGQKQAERLRELVAATSRWQAAKVTIEWPPRYIAELCAALAIPFVQGDEGAGNGQQPAKVRAGQFMSLYQKVQITHVQLGVDQPGLDIFYRRVDDARLPAAEDVANELSVAAVRYCPE